MKKSHILIAIFILTFASVYSVYASISQSATWNQNANLNKTVQKVGCSDRASRSTLLTKAHQSKIRLLGEFEAQCESQVSDQLFYTVEYITEEKQIESWKNRLVSDLLEFEELGIEPIMVVKSAQSDLATGSAKPISTSKTPTLSPWNKGLDELIKAGVNPEKINTWILFPEPNVPTNGMVAQTPAEYTTLVTTTMESISTRFSEPKFVLVFNAMTFPNKNFSWGDQEYISWNEYLENIPSEKISALGVVAFPWLPKAREEKPALLEPNEYIPQWIIQEAVDATNVHNIWLITGTFASLYAQDPVQEIVVPAEIRKEWLSKTLTVVESWPRNGWNPTIVLSTQDLRIEKGSSDWGYWGSDLTVNQDHKWAVLEFVVSMRKQEIPLILSL